MPKQKKMSADLDRIRLELDEATRVSTAATQKLDRVSDERDQAVQMRGRVTQALDKATQEISTVTLEQDQARQVFAGKDQIIRDQGIQIQRLKGNRRSWPRRWHKQRSTKKI
ncbi:hypothetical protein P3T76_003385 [Phytophthora citrophthora]|uniref:Uncharacterized protein n=1 Tax=Phytophthora citrophthora TaxID=4793 RepID=A0AAD9GU75_9STRA|nr:hypothetical protein P3T76_003385 [Phytophthora citrophthora]